MSDIITRAREELARRGGVLAEGGHDGGDGCPACVRELRSVLLDLPWTDAPDGEGSPTDVACQQLNDAPWSHDAARTEGCLSLVALTDDDAADGWVERYALETVRHILPMALRTATGTADIAAAIRAAAGRCEAATDLEEARAAAYAAADAYADAYAYVDADADADAGAWAAADAAADACADAYANAYAAANAAAWAAAYAADCAADCAADAVLRRAVDTLIACHRGEPVSEVTA